MMNRFLHPCFLMLLINSFACNGQKMNGQWIDREITIDGNSLDWEGIAQNLVKEIPVFMATANDADNLYLMFRGNDVQLERRIRMMGMTVWLDADGNKVKDYGVCYTGSTDLHLSYRPERPKSDTGFRPDEQKMEKMREKKRDNLPRPGMVMIIHKDEREELVEINPSGPSAGSAYRDSVFCYEFKLPLPVSVDLGKKIKVGLEFGGVSDEDRRAMRPDRGNEGRPPDDEEEMGDRGSRPPGGMHGGPPGGRPPFRRQDVEKQELWFDISLAKPN